MAKQGTNKTTDLTTNKEKPHEPSADRDRNFHKTNWGIVALIAGLVILSSLFAFGVYRSFWLNNYHGYNHWYSNEMGSSMMEGRGMPHARSDIYIESNNSSSDSSIVVTSGVVVSVNDSGFELAGNGSRVKIKTTDSTVYNNTSDKKVSVNDSVIVSGTKSGDTITAKTVTVNNS